MVKTYNFGQTIHPGKQNKQLTLTVHSLQTLYTMSKMYTFHQISMIIQTLRHLSPPSTPPGPALAQDAETRPQEVPQSNSLQGTAGCTHSCNRRMIVLYLSVYSSVCSSRLGHPTDIGEQTCD